MKLLFKLSFKILNPWQLVGFSLANFVGALIVLLGFQAYGDVAKVLNSSSSLFGNDFIVLSKPISSVSTLAGVLGREPKSFNEADIEALKNVTGVSRVEAFRTASFPVFGIVALGEFEVSTEMFIESVPIDFINVDHELWTASVEDDIIPIIVPRSYLNFYNYGFATARGLPQIGESLFSKVPIKLIFRGSAKHATYEGKIVGFSDNLNTILVPEDFLVEANRYFTSGKEKKVTRVIVESDGTSTDAIMEYISKHKYVVDGNGGDSMRLLALVRKIITVVIGIGLLVSLLSFFLLMISIFLMMEKNRHKNNLLHQLGYPDGRIALPYQLLAIFVDILIWGFALVAMSLIYPSMNSLIQLASPNFESMGYGATRLLSVLLCSAFALIHVLLIRRKIR